MNTYSYNIISIEGNIGSGKSTIMSELKTKYKNNKYIVFVAEPISDWINLKDSSDGMNIVEKYYSNIDKYAFSFQINALITRVNIHNNTLKYISSIVQTLPYKTTPYKFIIITERSFYTDKLVFAKMLYDKKSIEEINYKIYLSLFDNILKEKYTVNHIININTSPNICYDRIVKRNRSGEETIPLEYLETCNNYHIAMFNELQTIMTIIDGNQHIQPDNNILEQNIKLIDKTIQLYLEKVFTETDICNMVTEFISKMQPYNTLQAEQRISLPIYSMKIPTFMSISIPIKDIPEVFEFWVKLFQKLEIKIKNSNICDIFHKILCFKNITLVSNNIKQLRQHTLCKSAAAYDRNNDGEPIYTPEYTNYLYYWQYDKNNAIFAFNIHPFLEKIKIKNNIVMTQFLMAENEKEIKRNRAENKKEIERNRKTNKI